MPDTPPSLVFVVLDAARAQNFSCYGYPLKTTPFLSSLAEKAVFYENAISSSYWTMPSFASMFTGTYVSRHGLIIDGHTLRPDLTTLASFLAEHGYDTAGFCSNPYVSDYTGLNRGFDYCLNNIPLRFSGAAKFMRKLIPRSRPGPTDQRTAGKVIGDAISNNDISQQKIKWLVSSVRDGGASDTNRSALKWLKNRRDAEKPFFLFIHYTETHAPYCPPWPYRNKFLNDQKPGIRSLREINQNRTYYNSGKLLMDERDFVGLRALYDGSLAYSDKCVKELYHDLERTGLLDNTIFVVTSDHGDNLGEHNLMSHVHCLYDTLIRIPLIIRWPSNYTSCGLQDHIVQNIDLFPTMADILGDDSNLKAQFDGESLLINKASRRRDFAVSELIKPFGPDALPYRDKLSKYDRRLVAVRSRDYKYIWASNGCHEFYDISSDPEENNNIYNDPSGAKNSDACKYLSVSAKKWIESSNALYERLKAEIEFQSVPDMDDEIKASLSDLGYF